MCTPPCVFAQYFSDHAADVLLDSNTGISRAADLKHLKHAFQRLQSVVFYVLRGAYSLRAVASDSEEHLREINALIAKGRTRLLADLTVLGWLLEEHFDADMLTSNLHTAVAHLPSRMVQCGHPLPEHWMEQLMNFMKSGVRAPKRVEATMMNDVLVDMCLRQAVHHPDYSPVRMSEEDECEKVCTYSLNTVGSDSH